MFAVLHKLSYSSSFSFLSLNVSDPPTKMRVQHLFNYITALGSFETNGKILRYFSFQIIVCVNTRALLFMFWLKKIEFCFM